MRKNFFKYVAVALVAMMLLSTTAFAATTTTTTYKGDYITVSSTVSGATGDEQVTYLVYQSEDADIADSEIIYINQKAATEGTATFDYKVVKGEPLPSGTAIIAGSTSGSVVATEGDNIDPLAVTVVNNTDLVVTYDEYLGNGEKGTLSIADVTGGKAYVNDVEYTGAIEIVGGQTYTVTFVADEVPELPSITEDQEVEVDGNAVTVFATVANLPDGAEYGVQLTLDGVSEFFPALGSVDGKYAVKFVDVDSNVLIGEYSVDACYKVGDDLTFAD